MDTRQRKFRKLLWFFIFSLCTSLVVIYLFITQGYVFLITHGACPAYQPLVVNPGGIPIELTPADGASISALYYPSLNQAAVVALGGLDGALGDNLPPVSFLIQAGYGVLQIGSRSCASPARPVTLGYRELDDAKAALDFLRKQPEIDQNKIGLIGFSMGAATAIRLAAQSDQIAAVVAEGGYFNLGADILDSDRSPAFIQRVLLYGIEWAYRIQIGADPHTLSPIDALPHLAPMPILLIFGEGEILATRARQQITAAGDTAQALIVPGGSHGTNYLIDRQSYETQVLGFFDANLQQLVVP